MTSFREIERVVGRYDAAVAGLDAAVTARIDASIDAAYRNLERGLRALYPTWQSQGSLYALQRRLLLMQELGPLLEIIRPEQRAEYEALMAEVLQTAHERGATLADELVSLNDPGYPLQAFTSIPIEAAVLQARDGLQRLYRYNDEFKTAVSGVVEQGLIQGWGADKVARMLRGNQQMRGQFGVAQLKSKAETIARTEIMSAFNDAAQQRYEQNGIDYFQWVVTPSEALCPYCAGRNGNVYEVGKVRLPAHPRCRCLPLPWSEKWQKRGWTDDAGIAKFRDRNLEALSAQGLKPNYGPTYWERKNQGFDKAPEPVWKPGDEPLQTQQRQSRSPRLRTALQTTEDRIVRQSTETAVLFDKDGNQLWEKSEGREEEVRFTNAEVKQMRGGTLTHNHPLDPSRARRGSGFTQADIDLLFRSGLSEIRAVSGDYEYSLSPGNKTLSRQQWREKGAERWEAIADEEIAAVRKWRDEEVAKGRDSDDLLSEMNFRVWHRITERFADEFGLEYSRQQRAMAPAV